MREDRCMFCKGRWSKVERMAGRIVCRPCHEASDAHFEAKRGALQAEEYAVEYDLAVSNGDEARARLLAQMHADAVEACHDANHRADARVSARIEDDLRPPKTAKSTTRFIAF